VGWPRLVLGLGQACVAS